MKLITADVTDGDYIVVDASGDELSFKSISAVEAKSTMALQ
jgi:hypothetical protein